MIIHEKVDESACLPEGRDACLPRGRLWMFGRARKRNSNNEVYQFWQQNNHPIELATIEMVEQRLNYLHQNTFRCRLRCVRHRLLVQ
ncbi:MAG TPA: hypothetical protein VF691_17055 [Cytophagaceae bacterium]